MPKINLSEEQFGLVVTAINNRAKIADVDSLLSEKVDTSSIGNADGVAALGSDGRLPMDQLPYGTTPISRDHEFVIPDDTEVVVDIEIVTGSVTADVEYDDSREYFCQPGEYRDFAMEKPKGRWMLCDGRELNRTEYSELFKAISTIYGEGDGLTTFNIPDMRRMFKRSNDYENGRKFGSIQSQDWKGIYLENGYEIGYSDGRVWTGKNMKDSLTPSSRERIFTGMWSGPTVSLSVHWDDSEIRPANISVYTCIRY